MRDDLVQARGRGEKARTQKGVDIGEDGRGKGEIGEISVRRILKDRRCGSTG